MDNTLLYFIFFIVFILAIMTIASSYERDDLNTMGQMICSDKNYGEFVEFNSLNREIVCKQTNYEKYDGGYIKIVR